MKVNCSDSLCGGGYRAILADPPWDYGCKAPTERMRPCVQRGDHPGSVNHYYQTLKLSEICAMPVADMAAPNSTLWLWATVPLLPDAFEVMKKWGFRYKTMLTWYKVNGSGMGYWFRGQTEHVLLGVRGRVPAFRSKRRNHIETKVFRHSAKPEYLHEIIEELCAPPLLELFARRKRAGWTCFGNDIEPSLFDV